MSVIGCDNRHISRTIYFMTAGEGGGGGEGEKLGKKLSHVERENLKRETACANERVCLCVRERECMCVRESMCG